MSAASDTAGTLPQPRQTPASQGFGRPLNLRGLLNAVLLAALACSVFAASAAETAQLERAGTNLRNPASLQHGAALYVNYCSGCHSLQFQRYSRTAEDLGLTEEQAQQYLNFAGAQFGDVMKTGIDAARGEAFFGKAPPDLSLIARSRGPDWIFSYLKSFYIDESRPLGWNNTVYPGASMPNALWELQGIQRAKMAKGKDGLMHPEKLELASPGRLSPEEFDQAVRDITAFLEYVGEPAAIERQSLGIWVILFLALLTGLTYLLKLDYWRDVH